METSWLGNLARCPECGWTGEILDMAVDGENRYCPDCDYLLYAEGEDPIGKEAVIEVCATCAFWESNPYGGHRGQCLNKRSPNAFDRTMPRDYCKRWISDLARAASVSQRKIAEE